MDQYSWNEKADNDEIAIILNAIPENLRNGDYARAISNYKNIAELHADLGILHWRHGLSPRADFVNAIQTYETMCAMARQHSLGSYTRGEIIGDIDLVYAALFLMGRKVDLEFRNDDHRGSRWLCYRNYLSHVLHDRPIDAELARWFDKYQLENNELVDETYITYLELLGLRQTNLTKDELVRVAEANWSKRKTSRVFEDTDSRDGYGVMNDLYVDIYLAAVLKKIGWQGKSIHMWIWG